MLKSTFTAFYRSFTRHPLYALLNLLGLSLGIAVFITLGLFFRFETTFESSYPNTPHLYIVETTWMLNGGVGEPDMATSGSLLDDLRGDFQIDGFRDWDEGVTIHIGSQSTHEAESRVDTDFFRVLGLGLIAGDATTALDAPSNIVLTQAMADKYFPGVSPASLIGHTVRMTDEEGTNNYRITGVMKTPADNTDFDFRFVRAINPAYTATVESWTSYGSQRLMTVLSLTPQAASHLDAAFPAFLDRHAAKNLAPDRPSKVLRLSTEPLGRMHLQDAKARTSVYALGIVGLLAFFIAAINYVNLATARAGMRAKEVAVRKTLGATQGSLRAQFLCEALLTTIIAALIGLSLVELSLPLINSIGGLKLKLDYVAEGAALAIAGGFILFAGLLAGLYPAFVLAAFKPAQVLASSRTPAGGRWAIRTREALVVVQFAVVIAFFIMITGFFTQLRHMKTADVGFDRSGVILTTSTYDDGVSDSQRNAIWAGFRALPGVEAVTAAMTAPGDQSENNGTSIAPPGYTGPTLNINWVRMGPDYFKTYGGRVISGRTLDANRADDVFFTIGSDGKHKLPADGAVVNVVINRAALKLLRFASPESATGQLVTFENTHPIRIVGVVENMRFHSAKSPVPATLYLLDAEPQHHAITGVRYAGVSEAAMRDRMEQVWKGIVPEVPFTAVSAADNLGAYYKEDHNRTNLFSVGAGIAAFIGCIGLYGMAAFNTSRRAREIGLRKVLGASSGQVSRLLIGQFLRPVILANVLAWPIAFFALRQWLSQFDDAVAISPLFFIGATVVALLIALVTVGGLALMNAGAEPGKALRHE